VPIDDGSTFELGELVLRDVRETVCCPPVLKVPHEDLKQPECTLT
jgi:hypothetical protein